MAYTVCPTTARGVAIQKQEATPPVRLTAGQGAAVMNMTTSAYALLPINTPTTDFFPLVRIPTNSIVHSVKLGFDAAPSTSITGSLGLTFSDALDGTPSVYQSTYAATGASPSIVSQSFFLYQTAIQTYTAGYTDVTFKNAAGNSVTDGFYVPSASVQPLWQALSVGGQTNLGQASAGTGVSAFASCQSDPFGFFDVTWFETSVGVNTAAVYLVCEVTWSNAAAS